MATKTQTLTPKQAQVKIATLLRGIDNNNVIVYKRQEQTKEAVKEVQKLLTTAVTPPTPKEEKPKKSKEEKPKKPEKSQKVEKVVKAEKAEKVVKAEKPEKAEKLASKQNGKPAVKPGEDTRPPLKLVISKLLNKAGKPVSAADIYQSACSGEHKWSRQSVYNALEKHFEKTDEGYKVRSQSQAQVNTTHLKGDDHDEAEEFVKSVEESQSTSSVL